MTTETEHATCRVFLFVCIPSAVLLLVVNFAIEAWKEIEHARIESQELQALAGMNLK